jgi:hypothetical protein
VKIGTVECDGYELETEMKKLIEGILDRKRSNKSVLQRVYERDLAYVISIKKKLKASWGYNASFADAISFLIEFHRSKK